MTANTLDEVLIQLEKIINESIHNNDRTGYFAALYYKVTSRVKEGIKNNEFTNGLRMEDLDVCFANRYLEALTEWRSGKHPSRAWAVTFDATRKSSFLVLQHLLLGINAHINLDLGIAAAEVATKYKQNINNDFNTINTIIGSLTYEVINEIDRISPLLSLFGLHATNYDSMIIQFSITNARDGAWSFSQLLNEQTGTAYQQCIDNRDKDIAKLAEAILHQTGLIKVTMWVIHLFEWKSPGKIIRVLHGYKKRFIKALSLK